MSDMYLTARSNEEGSEAHRRKRTCLSEGMFLAHTSKADVEAQLDEWESSLHRAPLKEE
jgi:hypothetical protein